MRRYFRRLLRLVVFLVMLLVAIVSIALISTQTGWFKDWLRRYIMRQSAQFLQGELQIGRLSGNLFFGVALSDVTLTQDGQPIIAIKDLKVDYSAFDLVSSGIVLDEIELNQPVIRARRSGTGWNLAQLVRKQAEEEKRRGPGRPVTITSIKIHDGFVSVDGRVPGLPPPARVSEAADIERPATSATSSTAAASGPMEIRDLDAELSFVYRPVDFIIDIGHISLRSSAPALWLQKLAGRIEVSGDDVTVNGLKVKLPQTDLAVDGKVLDYNRTANVAMAVKSNRLSFQEIGTFVPGVGGIPEAPALALSINGPFNALRTQIDMKSASGDAKGLVTVDAKARPLALEGDVVLARFNPTPWVGTKAFDGDVNGRAQFTLRFPDGSRGLPVKGAFHFVGPSVLSAGYAAQNVDARGSFEGGKFTIDRARVNAYGGLATTLGTIQAGTKAAPGVRYALKGRVQQMDLRRLPKNLKVPALDTVLDLDYDVDGRGSNVKADALLHASTVEGARIAEGLRGHLSYQGGQLAYGGAGRVDRIDLQRFGRALDVDALQAPRFRGVLYGDFQVEATGTGLDSLRLQSSGTVSSSTGSSQDGAESTLFDAVFPRMTYDARLDRGHLDVTVDGAFRNLDPSKVTNLPSTAATLAGQVDGRVRIDDLRKDVTLDAVMWDGRVALDASSVRGLSIQTALVDASLERRVANVRQLDVQAAEGHLVAKGAVALDESSQSNLTYEFTAPDLAPLGKMFEQTLSGNASTKGTLTGNATRLTATGTALVEPFRYGAEDATSRVDADKVDAQYVVHIPDLDAARVTADARADVTKLTAASQVIDTVKAAVGYEQGTRALTFDVAAAETGPARSLDAGGRAVFGDGRQDVWLTKLRATANGSTWTMPAASAAPQPAAAPAAPATPPQPAAAAAATPAGDGTHIAHDGAVVRIDRLALVNGQQRIDVDGTIGVDAATASSLRVGAAQVDLAEVERIVGAESRRIAGLLNATATVTGTRARPQVQSDFTIVNGGVQGITYDRLGGKAGYGDDRVTLDVTLREHSGAELTARGTLPTALFADPATVPASAANAPVDLAVTSTPISLGLVQGLTQAVTQVEGTAQIDMRVTGTARDPLFSGTVNVDSGALVVSATGAHYAGMIARLRFEPSQMVIDQLRVLDNNNDPLDATGQLGLHRTKVGAVELSIQSKEFAVLENRYGQLDVDTNLRVTGELLKPKVTGDITIHTGRLQVDTLLRELVGGPYATEASLEMPDVGVSEAAVPAVRSASAAQPQPELPQPEVPKLQPEETPAAAPREIDAPEVKLGLWSAMDLNVRVQIPNNLILRGRNIRTSNTGFGLGNVNVTVGGDLRVIKPPSGSVVLVGVVNTVRGTYDFQGRRFDILRDGRIAFQGSTRVNPVLDVTAERVIQPSGIEARIRIEGTARNPRLSFSSDPPLDESDILALIVFNRPLNDLQSGEQSSLAHMAGSAAAGFIVTPIAESIGRALNLDLFEVQTTNDTGATAGVVTVGEQVGESLFVKLRQQFGNQPISEFILEYELTKFLRLQGSIAEGEGVGQASRLLTRRVEHSGIDLIFHFRY